MAIVVQATSVFMRIDSIIYASFGSKNVENSCKLKWLARYNYSAFRFDQLKEARYIGRCDTRNFSVPLPSMVLC